jgi:hypothetical protein
VTLNEEDPRRKESRRVKATEKDEEEGREKGVNKARSDEEKG